MQVLHLLVCTRTDAFTDAPIPLPLFKMAHAGLPPLASSAPFTSPINPDFINLFFLAALLYSFFVDPL